MTASDLQIELETLSGVKYAARTIHNRLIEAVLKSRSARMKPFIDEKQRRVRWGYKKYMFYTEAYP